MLGKAPDKHIRHTTREGDHVIREGDRVGGSPIKKKRGTKSPGIGRKTTTWATKDRISYIWELLDLKGRKSLDDLNKGKITAESLKPMTEDIQHIFDVMFPFIVHYMSEEFKKRVPDPFAGVPNPLTWSHHDEATNDPLRKAGLGEIQKLFFEYLAHKVGYSSLKESEIKTTALDF